MNREQIKAACRQGYLKSLQYIGKPMTDKMATPFERDTAELKVAEITDVKHFAVQKNADGTETRTEIPAEVATEAK